MFELFKTFDALPVGWQIIIVLLIVFAVTMGLLTWAVIMDKNKGGAA